MAVRESMAAELCRASHPSKRALLPNVVKACFPSRKQIADYALSLAESTSGGLSAQIFQFGSSVGLSCRGHRAHTAPEAGCVHSR
jgi:hypothetical protein